MATYYSSHNAGGSGAGTIGDPFTLQELLDNTDSGDLGLVMATGTYTPSALLDADNASATTNNNPAIIRGANSDGSDDGTIATISGSSLPASTDLLNFNVDSISIRLEGLRFTAGKNNNITFGGSTANANVSFYRCRIDNAAAVGLETQETSYPHIKLINCEIDSNTGDGIAPNVSTRYTPFLEDCLIHDNGGNGLTIGGNTAVPSSTHILHCAFWDNGDNGIEVLLAVRGLIIKNCVFFNNTNSGIVLLNTMYGITLTNCIFRSNGAYGIDTNSGTERIFTLCDYNCYSYNTTGDLDISIPGSNNVTSDPLFTSETDGSEDFTLGSSSPCKNVGIGYNG